MGERDIDRRIVEKKENARRKTSDGKIMRKNHD